MYFNTRPDFITYDIEKEFQEYCITKFPAEACAFIIDGKLVPVDNISTNSENEFELSSADQFKITKAQAFIHSHPNGDLIPSEHDFLSQKSAKIPYGICTNNDKGASQVLWFGDHLLDKPLEERPFIYGVFDCWNLVRSVYKQERNIILPNFYTEYAWWDDGRNCIEDNLIAAGGKEITDDLQKYDIIAMSFRSSGIISHLAVYMGDGMILHHLDQLASNRDYHVRWARFIRKIYRYNG